MPKKSSKKPDGVRSVKQSVGEKEGILAIAMLLLASGATLLMDSARESPVSWEHVAVSLIIVGIGVGLLAVRGILKTNRWSHLYVPLMSVSVPTIIPVPEARLDDDGEDDGGANYVPNHSEEE